MAERQVVEFLGSQKVLNCHFLQLLEREGRVGELDPQCASAKLLPEHDGHTFFVWKPPRGRPAPPLLGGDDDDDDPGESEPSEGAGEDEQGEGDPEKL
eukprot:5699609-Pyramimonas_sp.AAC.1